VNVVSRMKLANGNTRTGSGTGVDIAATTDCIPVERPEERASRIPHEDPRRRPVVHEESHRSCRNDQVHDRPAGLAVPGEDQEKEGDATAASPPASPSIPSMKLYRLSIQTTQNAPVQSMPTLATPISTRKHPEGGARGKTEGAKPMRTGPGTEQGGEIPQVVIKPERNMARANRKVYGSSLCTFASPATRNTHPRMPAPPLQPSARPPILGVGREWELRSLGTSITPTRSAIRMEIHTPAAEIAKERTVIPNVTEPNACTTAPSLRSPLPGNRWDKSNLLPDLHGTYRNEEVTFRKSSEITPLTAPARR